MLFDLMTLTLYISTTSIRIHIPAGIDTSDVVNYMYLVLQETLVTCLNFFTIHRIP